MDRATHQLTMTVLTIVSTTAIYYSTQSEHQSSYSKSSDAAYRLAESGINNALAVYYLIDVYDCADGCGTEEGTPGDYDITVTVN